MAKLPSLITNATSGEAISYYGGKNNTTNVWFKQEFNVTQNSNFTWTVTSKLYIKIPTTYTSGGTLIRGIWQRIGNEYFRLEENIIIGVDIYNNPIISINGNKVSNNPYEYYKLSEITKTYQCNNIGRYAVRIDCGFIDNQYSDPNRYCSDYTLIYDTLPSFSGLEYKINGSWKYVMPWIKVNGTWKRANQFMKINGEWKEYHDTWIWNPEA